jgi:DNA-binding winged helix-turn-helix (wHTH) protein
MAEVGRQLRQLRFENFEVDLRSGELRKAGVKLKFGGQPFQVLSILLERPGDLVTREELQERLWPDTFVDVEHNLNTAINKIREALSDSAESPRFVETLPRRGYRFIGDLEAPVQPTVPGVAAEPDRGPRFRQRWFRVATGFLAVSVVALPAVLAYRWHQREHSRERAALTAIPLTALPGVATSPALSDDGSRIAFAWNGDPAHENKGFDLYVKSLAGC